MNSTPAQSENRKTSGLPPMTTWLGVATLIWVVDRYTKFYVVTQLELGERVVVWPFFSWIHLNNTGAAFSFLQDAGGWQRWFFVVLAIVFSAYLLHEMKQLSDHRLSKPSVVTGLSSLQKLMGWSYALILSGALGNLYDRVAEGHVVDFILVHYQNHYFPAFNVADSAITVGAAGWILSMILHARSSEGEGST